MENDLLEPFEIGDWHIDPRTGTLQGPLGSRNLGPEPLRLLVALVERRGEWVGRQELTERIRPGEAAETGALEKAAVTLFDAFGGTTAASRIIETAPDGGYRLLPPARLVASPPSVPARNAAGLGFQRLVTALLILLVATFALGSLLLRHVSKGGSGTLKTRSLSSQAGTESRPALSPDGRSVAFGWEGQDGLNRDIYSKTLLDDSPVRLTSDPGREGSPAWAPDGRSIAYQRLYRGDCGIYLTAAGGGRPIRLGDCGHTVYPDLTWSPDGLMFAFNARAGEQGPYAIHLLYTEDNRSRVLTDPPAGVWGDHDPAFSADNATLFFTRSVSEGIQDLHAVDLVAGAEPRRLTDAGRNIVGFTPAGKDLVFASNRDGILALWRLPQKGGVPVKLPLDAWNLAYPDQARAGGPLVCESFNFQTDIWLRPRAQAASPLVTSLHWDLQPGFSPDGARIAFASNRDGGYEIWTCAADGSDPQRLTAFKGSYTSTPRWSPDGSLIAFDSRPEGPADIFIIPAQGGEPRRFTKDKADDLAPSWSRDGRSLYFASNRDGSWQIWQQNVAEGPARKVTSAGGYCGFEGPGGEWLYYSKHNQPGLFKVAASGGAEVTLVTDLALDDWGNWGLCTEGLCYVARAAGSCTVRLLPYDSDTARDLFVLPNPIPSRDSAFTVSPDGSAFLFGQTSRVEVDLRVIDAFR